MSDDLNVITKDRISKIRFLTSAEQGASQYLEAASLALTVLHDTVGGSHPLYSVLDNSLKKNDYGVALAASRGVATLFEQGSLKSPRLTIAHEIEGDLLDIANTQAQAAEMTKDLNHKQLHLAIAAFLTGASLEDALRRLCDANGIAYDVGKTTISKLQTVLYQPAKHIEIISASDNKQITTWGDSRNKADHGRFAEITQTEVVTMLMGVRAFIDRYLH
ncbi:MAG: hypothetical protein E8D42_16120 [Nitrospira sp.]|nr:MAG: hypothetical protein E8D42_16120 [Nitrospira sp.]